MSTAGDGTDSGEHTQPQLSHEDYTVGWICALPTEYVAAQVFLDETHMPPTFTATHDNNDYTLGRIGKHNVAIGVLPGGEYGTASAASVARDMLHTFSNIRIGLMVGIGGGAPTAKHDIRLGDVVVSKPENGLGGVFQYDFGKSIQDQPFQSTRFLAPPPPVLLTAVNGLMAKYDMDGHSIQEDIERCLVARKRLRKKYSRPDVATDRLYQSDVIHSLSEASCLSSCGSDASSIIVRSARGEDEDDPAIHYGLIASANQLMKDAKLRDQYAKERGILCFEMEAGGLMNHFPCLVIRGVCDYSDTHKNKEWQGYAAMAAAAYAKDLLHRVLPNKVETEPRIAAFLESFSADMKNIQFTAENVQREIQGLHESAFNTKQAMVLNQLHIAEGASFDSYAQEHNRYCLPNTRVELLQQIAGWAKDPNAEPTFWLNGMAGTGKSTISRTVAISLEKNGQLGASFFFKKGEADRGSLSKFFMTIAADLVVRRPSTAPHIENALIADRSLTSKNATEQFQKFLLEPLSRSELGEGPVVIVVDALDECDKEDDIQRFLYLVSRLETELPDRVRIFLTSRPEEPFRSQFEKIKRTNSRVILHEIPEPVVEHDINVFLRHELSGIQAEFNSRVPTDRHLSLDWPGQSSFDRLLKMAVPLFIVAATICRFISEKKIGTPAKLLDMVLSRSGDRLPQLETTYLSVLDNLTAGVVPSQREPIIQEFRLIVGSIILLASPLSTSSLAELLSISKDDIDNRLDLLHSVLSISTSAQTPVRLLHLSFRDFLLHPEEPTMPFRVDSKQTHANLTVHCLRIMDCLKKDICDIKSPGTPRSDINSERIKRYLSPEVQYSCQYWVYHFKQADITLSDGTDASAFLQKHFLHWIEALALIGRASESLRFLRTLLSQCKEKSSLNTLILLEDAIRFMQSYMPIISSTPLQLYYSLLIFTPKQSKIRTRFEDSEAVGRWICLKPRMEEYWNSCLQTLEGHSESVMSVAFSHNSTLVASSSDDATVRIWHANTGECVQTLAGHSKSVRFVVFSHNSTLVASGSHDKTVRIWRADTGECVQTLAGHSELVTSVVFSHDSTFVASGSDDKTVRIWRAGTGECVQTLAGHSNWVISVVFSHDSTFVASGSYDKTVRIWCADTGKCVQTLDIGQVSECLLFSRNGSYIITNVGAIAISGGTPLVAQLSVERSGTGVDKNWITCATPPPLR